MTKRRSLRRALVPVCRMWFRDLAVAGIPGLVLEELGPGDPQVDPDVPPGLRVS